MSESPVRLLDLTSQNSLMEAQLQDAFTRVLRSGQFILGAEVEAFESELAAFNQSKFALGISSGTDALLLALMALEIGPGDEVICPSFTFFATAGCVARLGAIPVFVDSCPACFNLNIAEVEAKITARTRAIVPVHLFGQSCDLVALLPLAEKRGLPIIEDTAQAMGAKWQNKFLGTLGEFGTLSFFPSKNLGALGDAGGLLIQDEALYRRAKALRNHGMEPKYFHSVIGGNFRIDALQSAFLRVKLPHLTTFSEARARNAEFYNRALAEIPGVRPTQSAECRCQVLLPHDEKKEISWLILPTDYPGQPSIWNQYTLRVIGEGKRDALRHYLTQRGIGSEIYYPKPLHEQECFSYLKYKPQDFPWAHRLAGEVLSIPIYPELARADLERVVQTIADFGGSL